MDKLNRRGFLRSVAAFAATGMAACSDELLVPAGAEYGGSILGPFRATGRVQSQGEPISGVRISDGQQVIATDSDGHFELICNARPDFVFVCTPSGYAFPTDESGRPRHYVTPRGGRRDVTWIVDLLPAHLGQDPHATVFLGDVQVLQQADVEDVVHNLVPDIKDTIGTHAEMEVIAVGAGDMIFDVPDLTPGYLTAVESLGVPALHVLGNHDRDPRSPIEFSKGLFKSHFGPPYYSFDRGSVHYVVIDPIQFTPNGWFLGVIDTRQLEWLVRDLSFVEAGSMVVVMCHVPLAVLEGHARSVLEEILAPFRVHYFCGHWHVVVNNWYGRITEHVAGAVCGAWWSGPVCIDGAPKGYMLIRAQGEQISTRYKATGEPIGSQFRLYAPRGAGDLVANVWNWEPSWVVRCWADGEPLGAMMRRAGQDPTAQELYTGLNLPPRSPWVEPATTSHLFYVTPPQGWRTLVVSAVDGEGREYTDRVVR